MTKQANQPPPASITFRTRQTPDPAAPDGNRAPGGASVRAAHCRANGSLIDCAITTALGRVDRPDPARNGESAHRRPPQMPGTTIGRSDSTHPTPRIPRESAWPPYVPDTNKTAQANTCSHPKDRTTEAAPKPSQAVRVSPRSDRRQHRGHSVHAGHTLVPAFVGFSYKPRRAGPVAAAANSFKGWNRFRNFGVPIEPPVIRSFSTLK
jgi:hypothetical protein